MFRLAHISDPHLGPLPNVKWHELASKRAFGYVNWRRHRGAALGPQALQDLVADVKAAEPDHIAVTGDLMNLGLKAEIVTATRWLDSLGEATDVTVVPGNHDAYMPGAVRRFETAWHAYMSGDHIDGSPAMFPFVRRRGPIGIVGVSSAIATAPLMATGRILHDQAEALADALVMLEREGLFRIVLIHHPPVRGTTPWHKRLIGAERFRRVIASAGGELVLHGHNHRTSVHSLPGPRGPVPVVGATSASLQPLRSRPGGSYIMFRIGAANGGFLCDMVERGATVAGGPIHTLSTRRLIGKAERYSGTLTHA